MIKAGTAVRYELAAGNDGDAFSLHETSGQLRVAGPLDYEVIRQYELQVAALDGSNLGLARVLVRVVDVNDCAPVFERPAYRAQVTEEDDRGLPKRVLQVTAKDCDTDRLLGIAYSLTGEGVDPNNPASSSFHIDRDTGEIFVLKPLDRDKPDGRPQWKFTVFAQDEGGQGLVGYADIQVNVKDINDNAPSFPKTTYFGNVTENGTAGMFVMSMTAVDYDDPDEGTNAKLTYTIEKNVIEEEAGVPIFEIEPDTGIIKTAVCCLDREKTTDYAIQVVAIDGGGLKGTGTASIKIQDVNDMSPHFTKKEWFCEVEETDSRNIPEEPILTVSVRDEDETNDFVYEIIENSGYGSDKFIIISNSDGSGSIKIVKDLDYEDLMQRHGFRFKIRVSDKGHNADSDIYHTDYSWVSVRLLDVNDNKPQFENDNVEVFVNENAEIGTTVGNFQALDADNGGKSKIKYVIDRATDRRKQFSINNEGAVLIQRQLDRENHAKHQIRILAIDDGMPAKTSSATLMVIVQDVNDNAPRLIEDYQPVILEHIPPTKVAEIFATDDDDKLKSNGPPFSFRIDPNASSIIHASFKVECEQTATQGDGMAVLSSLRSFDRELQKQYIIPIIIKDSGNPPMSGTSTLTITIGDINDNMMLPGSKDIYVYNFMGQAPDTEIGRVYVYDLDDWDLPDKTFHWETTEHPLFQLNPSTGMITMREGTPNGRYKLKFRVYDHKHNQADIQANVTITVQNISEENVESSASVRIAGVSDEDFIRTWSDRTNTHTASKLSKLRDKVAELLNIHRETIIVYSVQLHSRSPSITDVRFTVNGSKKYKSFVLNGLIAMHRNEIEKEVGINITMVGINECLHETYNCEGSCTNNVSVDKGLHLVNANRTALVGVKVHVMPECTCAVHKFILTDKCHENFCFNGGRCIDTRFGPKCSCSSEFNGPRCQQTSRNFQGNSWAWYPALEVCGSSHLSLEFRTKYKAGLLLYNGPLTSPDGNETLLSDFISLELVDGMPRLLIDFGSGTLELKIITRKELNDEEWHRIDIFWDTESVRMVLDFCKFADITEQEDGSLSKFDYTICQAEGVVPPFSEYLNVNDPLQIGGCHRQEFDPQMFHWHGAPFTKSFSGCIRNIYYNRQLLDLGSSGFSYSNRGNCPTQRHRSPCSIGHTGARCTGSVLPTSFAPGSYIKYVLSFEPNSFSTDLQLRFRTREINGELFRASDKHGHEYAVLEINDSKLHFYYNLNSLQPEEKDLWLSNITVSDGQWHTVKVTRYGSVSILILDDGEGLRYNESFKFSGHQLLVVDRQEGVYVGGKAEYTGVQTFEVHNDYQKGCMEDIKLEGKQLPLPPAVNGTQWGQATMSKNLGYKCFSNGPCINIVCPEPFICVDLWNEYECACGEGRTLSHDGNACIDHNECLNMPCLNGGTCINQEPDLRYSCVCPKKYGGVNCEMLQEELTIKLGTDAVVAFFVCIIVILLLILILIVYNAICKEDTQKKKEEGCVGENIIKYDDEGGGKDSMMESDVTNVQLDSKKSMDASTETLSKYPLDTEPHVRPSIEDPSYSNSQMASVDDLHNFIHEGSGSVAGSLSSLASGTEEGDQEFDFLSKWGPKFHKLAHSYRHKPTESEEEGQQEMFVDYQQKSLSNISYNS